MISTIAPAVPRRLSRAGDDGAGSVLALAIVTAVLVVSLTVVAFGSALTSRQRVIAAADAGALAAADAASGAAAGVPCELAAVVAEAHRASLERCEIEGAVAVITVQSTVLGVAVTAVAKAGPEPAARSR